MQADSGKLRDALLSTRARRHALRDLLGALLLFSIPSAWLLRAVLDATGARSLLAICAGSIAFLGAAWALRRPGRLFLWVSAAGSVIIHAGLFPAMGAEPGIALLAGVWSAVLLFIALQAVRHPPGMLPPADENPAKRFSPAVLSVSFLGLLLALFIAGRPEGQRASVQLALGATLLAASLIASFVEWRLLRAGALSPALFRILAILTGAGALLVPWPLTGHALLSFRLVASFAGAVRSYEDRSSLWGALLATPARLVIATFVALSAVGGLILSLPPMSVSGEPTPLLDSLFTATSACCLTGLVVVDTATHWSIAGQAVILLLIQVGAIGIMTLSALATIYLAGAISGRAEGALRDVIGATSRATTLRLIRLIVIATLLIEIAGTALLMPVFLTADTDAGPALWHSLFHSVSAFCNAGFSTRSNSLADFAGNPYLLHVVSGLVILGGLGFGVLAGLRDLIARRTRRLPLQARLTLAGTAALLLAGAAGWMILDWDRSLRGLGALDRVQNAWFHSASLRTAGFNAIPIEDLSPGLVMLSVVWMFIGGGAGGNAGGVKVTTASVLFLAVFSVIRGRSDAEAFGRCLPQRVVYRAAAVVTIAGSILFLGVLGLLATQESPGARFDRVLFEAASAFGTVGLSMGLTAELDRVGKLIIMGLMLVGRTGPLTLVLLLKSSEPVPFAYPKEEVMVG